MSRAALTSVLLETLAAQPAARRAALPPGHPRHRAAQPRLPQAGAAVARRDRAQAELSRAPGEREEGVGVITLPDLRWGRCDIKSISLLPNVMARQQAAAAGCREAWLIDQAGYVTEGSASNAYIVDQDGRLVTHPLARADPRRRHALGDPRARARRRHRGGRAAVLAGGGPGGARGGAVQHQLAAAAGDRDRRSHRSATAIRAAWSAACAALYDAHLQ